MSKLIVYAHGGSHNHGCEALARTTAELFSENGRNELILASYSPEADIQFGLNEYYSRIEHHKNAFTVKHDIHFALARLRAKLTHDRSVFNSLKRVPTDWAKNADVAFSIGGDNYCYPSLIRDMVKQHDEWKSVNAKTVLSGCSFEPELLNDPDIAADIRRYDAITARETISYSALKQVNSNTTLVADSAFILKQTRLQMPEGFDGADIVGINTSPLIEQSGISSEIVRKNFEKLIESVINETDYRILLIPHVISDNNNDISVLQCLYDRFEATKRVALIGEHNCCELKGYISRCRFFIGARTHATIAAYSTCVPTLVVGYSVKSTGIAKDLFGTSENYVLPVQSMSVDTDLVYHWKWLQKNETACRDKLKSIMPEYSQRAYLAKEAVTRLI